MLLKQSSQVEPVGRAGGRVDSLLSHIRYGHIYIYMCTAGGRERVCVIFGRVHIVAALSFSASAVGGGDSVRCDRCFLFFVVAIFRVW